MTVFWGGCRYEGKYSRVAGSRRPASWPARFDAQTFDAGNVTDEQFRSVGTPRGIRVGVKYALAGQPRR